MKPQLAWSLELLRADIRQIPTELLVNVVAASPLVPRPVRMILYRIAGLKVASPAVYPRCRIVGRRLSIGEWAMVNSECYLDAMAPIDIGAGAHLGMRVTVITTTHREGATGRVGPVVTRPVTIGDDVWIGAGALLLPGARVGARTIIAAGAVVRGDCDADSVYGGVPARKISDRGESAPRHRR